MEKRYKIFIAINLPNDIKKELAKHQEKMKEKFIFSAEDGENYDLAKWVAKDNLHITLEFLGYLTAEEVAEVCSVAKQVARNHKTFSINLNKIDYKIEKNGLPSMIWAGGEKIVELSRLKNDLQKFILGSVNFKPEERNFSLHVTLARLKEWQFKNIDSVERPEILQNINLIFTVETIEVMESISKKGGAKYEILESVSLAD